MRRLRRHAAIGGASLEPFMTKWDMIIDVAECTNCQLCTLATMDEYIGPRRQSSNCRHFLRRFEHYLAGIGCHELRALFPPILRAFVIESVDVPDPGFHRPPLDRNIPQRRFGQRIDQIATRRGLFDAIHSCASTTTTASFPWTVTRCGPFSRARRTSSLNRALASCSRQRPGPSGRRNVLRDGSTV